jgi:hypothetical protein
MARRSESPTAPAGEGGRLASPRSELGLAQRHGILQTKAAQPLLTDAEIAAQYGVSPKAVTALLAAVTTDLQPTLRTYAPEVGELYLQAVREASLKGRHEAARDFLIDGGALPDRAKSGTGLNVTVIVSAPPGTPQYDATLAPPPLVLDVQAGPQAPLTPLLPPPLGDA